LERFRSVVSVWDTVKETTTHVFKGEGRFSGKLAMSPDGKWLALCEPDPIYINHSTVRIWDQRGGAAKGVIQSPDNIAGLFFTPDGKRLVGAKQTTYNSYLEVWDVESLEAEGKRHELGGLVNLQGTALSEDGRIFALAGTFHGLAEKEKHVLMLWDLVERHPRLVLDLGESSAKYLAFAPDNRTLLSAPFAGNEISVWDPRDGKRRETICLGEPAFDNIRSLAFAGDSRHFAASLSNGTACIVRIQTPPHEVSK
jgi:WD40 repeat protein